MKQKHPKKPFLWDKPVAGGEARPVAGGVPNKLNKQLPASSPKSTFTKEAKQFKQSKLK